MEVEKIKTTMVYRDELSEDELTSILYGQHEQKPDTIPLKKEKTILWNGKRFNCKWTKSDCSMLIRLSPLTESNPYIEDVDMSVKLANYLKKMGIVRLKEAKKISRLESRAHINCGIRKTKELEEIMASYGFKLQP